jgi:hypothetical protein
LYGFEVLDVLFPFLERLEKTSFGSFLAHISFFFLSSLYTLFAISLYLPSPCLQVMLYERGYDKDAANIAMEAIQYARQQSFDVVLVDTAGRMQNNEPLMRALAKVGGTSVCGDDGYCVGVVCSVESSIT